MILELHNTTSLDQSLIATWEIEDTYWKKKSHVILDFVRVIYEQNTTFNDNTILETSETLDDTLFYQITLLSQPNDFYFLQNRINEYLQSLGIGQVIN